MFIQEQQKPIEKCRYCYKTRKPDIETRCEICLHIIHNDLRCMLTHLNHCIAKKFNELEKEKNND